MVFSWCRKQFGVAEQAFDLLQDTQVLAENYLHGKLKINLLAS
jgi:hypothetical protein